MKEKTVFALRAPVDILKDSIDSSAQNYTLRFTSFKNRLVNGKVASTTLSVIPNQGDASWIQDPEVTKGDKEVEVNPHILKNTGEERKNRITYTQSESNKQIIIDLPFESSKKYTVDSFKNKYINGKFVEKEFVNYDISLDNEADYLLEKFDGSFQITSINYQGNTSAVVVLTQYESNKQIKINITTPSTKIENDILVTLRRSTNLEYANLEIDAKHEVASDINFSIAVQYGVSPDDKRTVETTLNKGDSWTSILVPIQKEANPYIIHGEYYPKEDIKYRYTVSFM